MIRDLASRIAQRLGLPRTRAWQRVALVEAAATRPPLVGLNLLLAAVGESPTDFWLCDRVGEHLRDRLHDAPEAISWFRRSFELHPIAWPLERIGEVHRDRREDPTEAAAWFQMAVTLDPLCATARFQLAEVLAARLDRPDEAMVLIEEAVALGSAPPAFYSRAIDVALTTLADVPLALRWATCGWKATRDIALGRRVAFLTLASGGPPDVAEELLTKLHAAAPAAHDVHVDLAMLRHARGHSARCVRQALLRTWSGFDAPVNLAWLADIVEPSFESPRSARLFRARTLECARRLYRRPDGATAQGAPPPPGSSAPQAVGRWRIPAYRVVDGRWSFARTHGPSPHRLAVTTLPKSGTHAVGRLLADLGLVDCGVLVPSGKAIVDDRFVPLSTVRSYPVGLVRPCPFEDALDFVRPGQVLTMHAVRTPRIEELLGGFRRVFVHRNLRDCLVSLVRHRHRLRRDEPWLQATLDRMSPAAALLRHLEAEGLHDAQFWGKIALWRHDSATLCISYEELMGDRGVHVQRALVRRLAAHAGLPDPSDPAIDAVVERVLGAPTATSTGHRTRWRRSWSPAIETAFHAFGFAELNAALGYQEPPAEPGASGRDDEPEASEKVGGRVTQ